MPKRVHPKINRQKAAELLEKAKQEEAKRYMEIGSLFAAAFLGEKPKTNGGFEEFRQKAAKILDRKTKKQPSPAEMRTTAGAMAKEAEQEEARRKQQIGDKLLQMLSEMQETKPGPGADAQALSQINTANLKKIKTVAEQIWKE
jgi:hypothetical protein